MSFQFYRFNALTEQPKRESLLAALDHMDINPSLTLAHLGAFD
jgi:hypothetical protein